MTIFRHQVTTEEDGMEVRALMRRHFDFSSRLRGRIKREKRVFLNGTSVPGYYRAKAGDVITIKLPDDRSYFVPEDIPIGCLFYIWYCKFPCYSLHTSHPLPPPLPLCP